MIQLCAESATLESQATSLYHKSEHLLCGAVLSASQKDTQYVYVDLPEKILHELKMFQSEGSQLRGLGIDDLVTLAVRRYFENKTEKTSCQLEPAGH
jgi:hypothetical protein